MPKGFLGRGLAVAALLSVSLLARAEPQHTFVVDNSAPRQILSVDSTGVVDLLQGATAYAFFQDGSSAQASFTVSGDNLNRTAVAQTPQFALVSISDVTRDLGRPVEWSITNTDSSRTLVGFAIDGRGQGDGHATFDISFGPSFLEVGTLGSERGQSLLMSFSGRTFLTGGVTVTYSQPLGLAGAAPVGDLFARVDVALAYTNTPLHGGLPPPTELGGVFSRQNFASDVDLVVYASTSPVPEPAAWMLLLGGAAVIGRRLRTRPTPSRAIAV